MINANQAPLRQMLKTLKKEMGEDLYYRLIERYNLQHLLKENPKVSKNDIKILFIGIVTNATIKDLEGNENLKKRFELLTEKYDDWKLSSLKGKNTLLDVDIKKIEKIQVAKTYESADQFKSVVKDEGKQKELQSGLYLAKDLSYRNFEHQSVIRVLDSDGKKRLYTVHNISNAKGLVCTALVPYSVNRENNVPPPEVKILFRGTHSKGTVAADLETRGAGSKTMRDNRLALLREVNSIVAEVQSKTNDKVSLSIHGHSLGGALAERFTSELHQAIFHQKNKSKSLTQDDNGKIDKETTLTEKEKAQVDARLKLNDKKMEDEDYSALANVSHITTTTANSARLSKKEAQIGEGFIALSGVKQTINHFKAKGDPVSLASQQNLGSGFKEESAVNVSLLTKDAGYGLFKKLSPILAHTGHPLMQSKDSKQGPLSFTYFHNQGGGNYNLLRKRLTSSKMLPRIAQKIYLNLPKMMTEPITWANIQASKATTKVQLPKGKSVVMESAKRESNKTKLKEIKKEIKILKMRIDAGEQNIININNRIEEISEKLAKFPDSARQRNLEKELSKVKFSVDNPSALVTAQRQTKPLVWLQNAVRKPKNVSNAPQITQEAAISPVKPSRKK